MAMRKCDSKQLIGFHWGQLLMSQMGPVDELGEDFAVAKSVVDDVLFSLEYVHAVISSHNADEHGKSFDSGVVHSVLSLATELGKHAMTSWGAIRGHRYKALEAEFNELMFESHDDALRVTYGVSSRDVAAGMKAAVDATRFGYTRAAERALVEMDAEYDFAEKEGIELEEAIEQLYKQGDERQKETKSAF